MQFVPTKPTNHINNMCHKAKKHAASGRSRQVAAEQLHLPDFALLANKLGTLRRVLLRRSFPPGYFLAHSCALVMLLCQNSCTVKDQCHTRKQQEQRDLQATHAACTIIPLTDARQQPCDRQHVVACILQKEKSQALARQQD